MLRSRLRADLKTYREAIANLEARVLRGETWQSFDLTVHDIERAQESFQESRARLEEHVAKHRCDGVRIGPKKLAS